MARLTTTADTTNVGSVWYNPTINKLQYSYLVAGWSTGGNLITGRVCLGGIGTQNAALAFGGSPALSCTEEYNGTSWSAGGALLTARCSLGGAGTQTEGLAFGGTNGGPGLSCTEEYILAIQTCTL